MDVKENGLECVNSSFTCWTVSFRFVHFTPKSLAYLIDIEQ